MVVAPMRKFGRWRCLEVPGCQRLRRVQENWRRRSLTPTQTWRTCRTSQTWRRCHHLQVQTSQTAARKHCPPLGCRPDTRAVASPPDGSSSAPCTQTLATSYLRRRMEMRMMMRTKRGTLRMWRTNMRTEIWEHTLY